MKPNRYKWHEKGTYDPEQYRAERIAKGLPVLGSELSKQIFFRNVYKTRECWFWIGFRNNHGYGVSGKPRSLAHRKMWQYTHGEIPKGMRVLHKCDIPQCVNPAHLFLGSMKDNMIDCSAKGRAGVVPKCFATINGRTQTLREWSAETGIGYQTLWSRLRRGVPTL